MRYMFDTLAHSTSSLVVRIVIYDKLIQYGV